MIKGEFNQKTKVDLGAQEHSVSQHGKIVVTHASKKKKEEEETTRNFVNQNVYDMGEDIYAFESLVPRRGILVFFCC